MNEKLNIPMREKYWNEQNSDERINTLYEELKHTRYQLTNALSLLEKLLQHSHADGRVVTPIDKNTERNYYVPIALQYSMEKNT